MGYLCECVMAGLEHERSRKDSKYITKPCPLKRETIKPRKLGPVLLRMQAGGGREEQGQCRGEDPREEWGRGRKSFEYGKVKCQDLTLKGTRVLWAVC